MNPSPNTIFSIRLNPNFKNHMNQIARASHMPLSVWIRATLQEKIDEYVESKNRSVRESYLQKASEQ